jgi:hypothetical protein
MKENGVLKSWNSFVDFNLKNPIGYFHIFIFLAINISVCFSITLSSDSLPDQFNIFESFFGPDSSYSSFEIHICWKVEREA